MEERLARLEASVANAHSVFFVSAVICVNLRPIIDGFVKSLFCPIFVIPAKAEIQSFQRLINTLDSGFHRSDDFLRDHHY